MIYYFFEDKVTGYIVGCPVCNNPELNVIIGNHDEDFHFAAFIYVGF